jgi:hypothetical protein
MPTSSPLPVPRTQAGLAPRSSAHCRISVWSVIARACEADFDLEPLRDELVSDELARAAELRGEEPCSDLPRAEGALLPRGPLAWLSLLDLLRFLELPLEVLLDALLLGLPPLGLPPEDRLLDELLVEDLRLEDLGLEDDDRALRDELLLRFLPLDRAAI